MKVLALTDCLIGYHTFWIRVGQYLKQISKDLNITIAYDSNLIRNLQKGDKLIFYRYSLEWGDLSIELEKAKSRGVYIISDVDDYLWHDGELRGWKKERLINYHKTLKECSVITCSTERLKDQLRVIYPKTNIEVVDNTISIYTPNKKNKSKIFVGLDAKLLDLSQRLFPRHYHKTWIFFIPLLMLLRNKKPLKSID